MFLPILLTSVDDFWNTLMFGSGGWLYIILIYAIIFLVSMRFRFFGIFGLIFAIFSIFEIITYGNANTFTLELAYRIITHGVASLLLILTMTGEIS